MTAIAIYVEGGGDTAHQKAELRQGFDAFLGELKTMARTKRLRWQVVCCGGRNQAYDAFIHATRTEPDRLNVLLVDSEGPVPDGDNGTRAVRHLSRSDGWRLDDVGPANVHLMIQCMETWMVADPDALARFYGQNFHRNSLPVRQNLEQEPKQAIYDALKAATRDTQKGEYGKIRHASRLLALLDAQKVKTRCGACDLLYTLLGAAIALT